jgi:phosphoserine aminotransferase
MNVCFLATNDAAETMLSDLAKANGVDGIKGHRSVGGFRASIYNAMEKESVQVLVDLMREVSTKLG